MDRRTAVLALLVLCVAPTATEAQQAAKVPRVGILTPGPLATQAPRIDAFKRGLRELGYVEGKSVVLEVRSAEGKMERLPDLAAELVNLKVDVIVAVTTEAILAAKRTTKTVPIVMPMSRDPVGFGIGASLAHPGGNITGLTQMTAELSEKRLALLKELVPHMSQVAVLWNPTLLASSERLREMKVAAARVGVQAQVFEVRSPDDYERVFSTMPRGPGTGLIVIEDPAASGQQKRIANLAIKNRLPSITLFRDWAEAGFLMSYGANLLAQFSQAAAYVDKILKGAKPGDLPIEQATTFELVINLKTAKTLGIIIPKSMLMRADRVIE